LWWGEIEKLRIENEKYIKLLIDYDYRFKLQDERIKSLEEDNRILHEENKSLREENQHLKVLLQDLQSRYDKLETKMSQINTRDAFRALEHYIILEVLGSKRQMFKRSIYNITALKNTSEFKNSTKWNDEKHQTMLELLAYFKDVGDITVHESDLDKKFLQQHLAAQAEELDIKDAELLSELLDMLENYCITHSKPFGKSIL